MSKPDEPLSPVDVMRVQRLLPNFPEDVIQIWLNEYVRHEGWPPAPGSRWDKLLRNRPLGFWQAVNWEETETVPEPGVFHGHDAMLLMTLVEGYGQGRIPHPSIPDGLDRFRTFLDILRKSGSLPRPPVLLKEDGLYWICDGAHRIAAWLYARILRWEVEEAPICWVGESIK